MVKSNEGRLIIGKIVLAMLLCMSCMRIESLTERPIVAVICTYNNSQYAEKNLLSIISQKYKNKRVIVVDDCSTDGTADVLKECIQKNNLEKSVTLICNTKRRRKLANLYTALYLCDDQEIVFFVDGDDWLHNNWVFSFINNQYNDPDVWMTYGHYRNEPAREAIRWGFRAEGYDREQRQRIIDTRAYRSSPFIYMHPRTFYAWLFKCIKLEDLIAEQVHGFAGNFYPFSNDNAVFYPIVEMAHKRVRHIANLLYIRNFYSPILGVKIARRLMSICSREIKRKERYPVQEVPVLHRLDHCKHELADIYIFAKNGALSIGTLLKGITDRVKGIDHVHIFYEDSHHNQACVDLLSEQSLPIVAHPFNSHAGETGLRSVLVQSLRSKKGANYIFFVTDNAVINEHIDTQELIYWIDRTYAYGFYTSLCPEKYSDRKLSWLLDIDDDICAWKFLLARGPWKNVHNLDMTLYPKVTIMHTIEALPLFKTVRQFEDHLKAALYDRKKVGISYMRGRVAC